MAIVKQTARRVDSVSNPRQHRRREPERHEIEVQSAPSVPTGNKQGRDRVRDRTTDRGQDRDREEELLRRQLNEVEKENALLRLERENQSRPRAGNLNNQKGRGDLPRRRRVRDWRAGTRARPTTTQQSTTRTTTRSKRLRNDEDEVRDRHNEREFSHDNYARSEQGRAGKRIRSKVDIPEDRDYEQEDSSSDGDVSAITDARLCKMIEKVMLKKRSREERIDRLHRAAGAPFKLNIREFRPPMNFQVPKLPEFDEKTDDPDQHVLHYETVMTLYQYIDELMCKMFPQSLTGGEITWFNQLPAQSIGTYHRLVDEFCSHYK
ncbi:zinc finger CCCH domain-containing protein 13-like [Papaver somniferum]|uniref:zinc finger CCCH domain-containing protein 13-like n=1 Tax=Papaver somniferum TaxID=3469 RepID=UPI000E6F68E0|nr:zinc finger CCCH domain-containing protein 13-like [Papaver somniferum]